MAGKRTIPRRRGSTFRTISLLMLIPVAGLILFLGWRFFRDWSSQRESKRAEKQAPAITKALKLLETAGISADRIDQRGDDSIIETVMDLDKAAAALRRSGDNIGMIRKGNELIVTRSGDVHRLILRRFQTAKRTSAPNAEQGAARPRITGHRGDIVLILDDVGFEHQPLESAMHIDPNISFSVLPNAKNAMASAEAIHRNGLEILCHLPMEPERHSDPEVTPGAGAIMTTMTAREIEDATLANVRAVPYAKGVNNHMGSRATKSRRVMSAVITALPKGMFFIDSRTTTGSVAEDVAHALHVPTASRSVFLDDVQSEPAVRRQLAALAAAAETKGLAIGIGHLYPVTVSVLSEEIPNLRTRGFRFLRASEAVR
ncbi:MAG TPA: divergent polysaccharide deacetylase family protein [Thermoanaerobaculia bacterium]|nr:divergent polysaccharide deacetylase family protein [Thermoanaerobaculia bacterium]